MGLPVGAGDPYWSNVVALLHLDTDFTDKTGKTWTASGGPAISSAQSKFGGGSVFSNAAGYVEGPTSSDWAFGTGDYTVECWAYSTAWPTGAWYCPLGNSDTGTGGWEFQLQPNGTYDWSILARGGEGNLTSSAGAFTLNTWHHCAYSRVGSTRYLFLDGALVTSASTSDNCTSTSAVRICANRSGGDFWKGYVDEVRITKGVGRYTQAFTPSTQAFYSHAPR
jgi:hypothetical protein